MYLCAIHEDAVPRRDGLVVLAHGWSAVVCTDCAKADGALRDLCDLARAKAEFFGAAAMQEAGVNTP